MSPFAYSAQLAEAAEPKAPAKEGEDKEGDELAAMLSKVELKQ